MEGFSTCSESVRVASGEPAGSLEAVNGFVDVVVRHTAGEVFGVERVKRVHPVAPLLHSLQFLGCVSELPCLYCTRSS